MQLLKLAIILTVPNFFFGCTYQLRQAQSEETPPPSVMFQQRPSTPLGAAIEELRVIRIKIEERGGIPQKEYGENLLDLASIVKHASGNPKALAATKSALAGHQLALQFWKCDRVAGFDEVHVCQDRVLEKVFAKYPDIKAQAMAAIEGENLPSISAGLDKDAVMQAIWRKTSSDTETAIQSLASQPPKQKRQRRRV